jgi:hypothetical protein
LEDISWNKFCKKLKKRFAEDSTYDVVKLFHGLKHSSTVDTYIDTFEATVGTVRRENPDIPESYYVKSFVSGLQDYEQQHTQLQKPGSLTEAYWIARRLEASNQFRKHQSTNWQQKLSYQRQAPAGKEQVPTPIPKPVTPSMSKPPQEQILVKNDKCFRCGDKWVPGHKYHCKMNKGFLFSCPRVLSCTQFSPAP